VTRLETLDRETFGRRLSPLVPGPADRPEILDRLHAHHEELVRWAPRVDLVGPGAAPELLERHYAESLAALPLLPEGSARLVDIGSGAGFPGWMLAAARPDLEVWLVEPRERRAAFLRAATRRAGLSARVLAARVAAASRPLLPEAIDLLTVRAVRLDSGLFAALSGHLAPGAELLAWSGAEPPSVPEGSRLLDELPLPGSDNRFVRRYRLAETDR